MQIVCKPFCLLTALFVSALLRGGPQRGANAASGLQGEARAQGLHQGDASGAPQRPPGSGGSPGGRAPHRPAEGSQVVTPLMSFTSAPRKWSPWRRAGFHLGFTSSRDVQGQLASPTPEPLVAAVGREAQSQVGAGGLQVHVGQVEGGSLHLRMILRNLGAHGLGLIGNKELSSGCSQRQRVTKKMTLKVATGIKRCRVMGGW